MAPRDLLWFTASALRGHPVRVGLCLTGIAIGITAMVVLTALGEGARRYVVNEFTAIGSNLLLVMPGKTETTGAVPGFVGAPHDLTIEDGRVISRTIPSVELLAPVSMGTETVRRGERRRQVPIVGTTAEFLSIRRLSVAAGAFLPEQRTRRGAPVVVLGHRVAQELFPGESALGQRVRVADWRMRVIGVLSPRGTQLSMDMDDLVLVPVTTGMQILNRQSLYRLLIKVRRLADVKPACRDIETLLAQRHGEEDVTCVTQDAVISTFSSIVTALTAGLAGIGVVSLIVAGVGVMNVMLVSVSDRTKEIGLLKACGVTNHQIMTVFVTEAVVLSILGGIVGLVGGWGVVQLFLILYPAIPAATPVWASVSAVAVSVVIGMTFGFMPAYRASRLDPLHALEQPAL